MNLVLILVVILIVLVGCEGYQKLSTGLPAQSPVAAAKVEPPVIKGNLTSQNFVEVPSTNISYVEFMSFNATKYREIPPYSKELDDAKEPYYLVSDNSVLFVNIFSGSYRIYLES